MKKFMNKQAAYIFIAPSLLLLVVFSLFPIILSLAISFTDISLVGLADWSKINFVGLTNYKDIISDPIFLKSITNTIFYVVIGVPLVIIISMSLAILINFGQNKVFQTFRLMFYSPAITNVVAVAVVWMFLYHPSLGLFNYFLSLVNLGPVPWLQDPVVAKLSLILMGLWRAIGTNMIIFLAALQGIPKDYYEAASLDGANSWQELTKITIPLLKFATFFVAITTLIGWMQFFEEPFIMTQGGPLDSTTSVSLFIYQNGFQFSKFGYAAAGSFLLFIVIVAVTLVQFKMQRINNSEEK